MSGYTVFCVDQIEGLPEQYYAKAEPRLDPVQRIEKAESFFAATQTREQAKELTGLLSAALTKNS